MNSCLFLSDRDHPEEDTQETQLIKITHPYIYTFQEKYIQFILHYYHTDIIFIFIDLSIPTKGLFTPKTHFFFLLRKLCCGYIKKAPN